MCRLLGGTPQPPDQDVPVLRREACGPTSLLGQVHCLPAGLKPHPNSTQGCVPDVPVEWKALCHLPENPGNAFVSVYTGSLSPLEGMGASHCECRHESLSVAAGWRLPQLEPPGICGDPAPLGAFLNVGVKHFLLFPFLQSTYETLRRRSKSQSIKGMTLPQTCSERSGGRSALKECARKGQRGNMNHCCLQGAETWCLVTSSHAAPSAASTSGPLLQVRGLLHAGPLLSWPGHRLPYSKS